LNRIWIVEYVIVPGPLVRINQKDVDFEWETAKIHSIAILKEPVCDAPALRMFDVSHGAGQIVVGVEASLKGWGAIFQQDE